jgi:hypothetical protein
MKIYAESDINELLAAEMAWAMCEREKLPFSASNGFRPRVTIIGPGGQLARVPCEWGSRDEMHQSMARIAVAARLTGAQAVMLASDSSAMDVAKVAEFLGLPVPVPGEPDSLAAFSREYAKVFNGDLLNRDMRNLPKEYWVDSIIVAIKGPKFRSAGTKADYTEGDGDAVVWTKEEIKPSVYEFKLLPDYWEIPEDDANLRRAMRVAEMFMARNGG